MTSTSHELNFFLKKTSGAFPKAIWTNYDITLQKPLESSQGNSNQVLEVDHGQTDAILLIPVSIRCPHRLGTCELVAPSSICDQP